MNNNKDRILVVDDELGMREGCRKVLTSEGFVVETAEDGVAALELFKEKNKFAVALIDLMMPRMGGIELIEEIRKFDGDIVLLVITAYATIGTAVEATKKGAYGYIPKPFTPDELLLPVKNGLEKRELSLRSRKLQRERDEKLLEVAYERSKGSTIIKCMSDGVIVVNREGNIVLTNTTINRFIPECTNIPNLAPHNTLACKDLVAVITEILSSDASPKIVSKEISREESTYMVNASPLVDNNGEMLGAVAILRDISELKKLEATKATFISMVSHEVTSHLGAIEGYLNLLLTSEDKDFSEDHKKMMERMSLRAQALRTMVSDLTNISAIETGRFSIKRVPLALSESVDEVLQLCIEKAESKKIELKCDYSDSSRELNILADKEALSTIVRNLIDNAIKYTPEGGHVSVSVSQEGKYVKVSVADDGIGMSAEEKNKIFEEFYRVKNKYTSSIPGSGLGLSLVKRLLDMHEGKILVESASGEGSVFTIILPKIEEAIYG